MKKILTIAAMLTVAFCAMAQSQDGSQTPDQMGNPPQMGAPGAPGAPGQMAPNAKMKAERMKQELSLTDKQYKKVLKVFEQEEDAMHPDDGGQMPGGGPGMGQGGPGQGGPGMGGPGMGQGGPGAPGQGGPGMGGQRPQGPPQGMQQLSDDEIDKIIAKKEKKLRKILTLEQFNAWASAHPEEFAPAMPGLQAMPE